MAWREDPSDKGWWINDETGESQNWDPRQAKPATFDGMGGASGFSHTGVETRTPTQDERRQKMDEGLANNQIAKWDQKSQSWTFVPMSPSELYSNEISGGKKAAMDRLAGPAPAPAEPEPTAQDTAGGVFAGVDTTSINPFGTPKAVPRAVIPREAFVNPSIFTGRSSRMDRDIVSRAPPAIAGFEHIDPAEAAAIKARLEASVEPPPPEPQPGDQAPDVKVDNINPLLDKVNRIGSDIAALSNEQEGPSAAEALLESSNQQAKQRAAIQLEASSRAALGAARSSRNRGDRALMERQAIGESTFLGQESARTSALQETEYQGQLGELRANEAAEYRDFRLKAKQAAADLGLNAAALELDISKANLESANNWINNEFEQMGLNKQIDQAQAEAILQYMQAQDLLQFDYDKLSTDDQNHMDEMLTQKYGIDMETATALKKIKEDNKFTWGKFAMNAVGGVLNAGGTIAGAAIGKK